MKKRHRCGYPLFAHLHNGTVEYSDDKPESESFDEIVRHCPGCCELLAEIGILSEGEWLEVHWCDALWVPPAELVCYGPAAYHCDVYDEVAYG